MAGDDERRRRRMMQIGQVSLAPQGAPGGRYRCAEGSRGSDLAGTAALLGFSYISEYRLVNSAT